MFMIPFLIMPISSLVTLRNDDVQEFDTRWDEILLSMTKIPADVLESLYKLRIRESDQLKNRVRIVRHGKSSENIGSHLSKVENNVEEEY